MFIVRGFFKQADEDVWNDGCQLGTGMCFESGHPTWSSETLEGIVKELMDFLCVEDKDAVLLDACEEIGRIDIQRTENAEGYDPSENEIEKWKKGECKMWLADYSFRLEKIETVSAVTGEVEAV